MEITLKLSLLDERHWKIIRRGVYRYECRLLQAQMNPATDGAILDSLISKHSTLCSAWTDIVRDIGVLGLPYDVLRACDA
jgi:hypothetical protein